MALLRTLILIFSSFLLILTDIHAQDWAEPEEKTKWFYGRHQQLYDDIDTSVSVACEYVSSTFAFYECETGIETIDTGSYTRLEVWFHSKRKFYHGWKSGYEYFRSKTILECPLTHPTALDANDDGVVDLCVRESCSDGKNFSLDESIGLKPGALKSVGNPIQCSDGQKIQNDVVYQGEGRDPLNYSVFYASPKAKDVAEQTFWSFNSQLGKQRNDNHYRRLELVYNQNGVKVYQLTYKNGFTTIFYGNASANQLVSVSSKGGTLTLGDYNLTQTKLDGTTFLFNLGGTLLSRTLPDGETRSYTYTATNKLATVTNHYGKQLQYFYNSGDLLERLVTPDGQEYFFEYDTNDNLIKVTYPDDTPADNTDNPTVSYLFENPLYPNNLTGKIDENGIRLATWNYDVNGRAISSEHGQSLEKVELDFSQIGKTRVLTHVSDTLTNETIYHYSTRFIDGSAKKRLDKLEQLECSDCEVGNWLFEYDNNGFVSKSTSPTGTVTTFEHNAEGFETARTEAFGTSDAKTILTEWNNVTGLPLLSIAGSLKTEFGYNNLNQRTSITQTDIETNEIRVETYSYGSAGVLSSIDGSMDGSDDLTSFTYDTQGNLLTIKNPLNQITTLSNYDANGRVGTITDPNGIVTDLTYTPRGWLKSSTISGALTQYQYFPTGSLKKVISPSGHEINYEYDDGERLIAISDNDGNRIEYTRDLMGNITQSNTKDSSGIIRRTQTAVFNALGQIKQSLGSNGQSQTLTYDADGNPLTTKNAKNDTTTSNYDGLNRLIKNIDPDGGDTNYGYDALDNLTSVTDAEGKTTTYEYNAFGEVTKITSPDTGVTTFTYDKAGNVLTKTDARNETTTYTYDALNRVLTQSYSDSAENIVYSYDDTSNGNKGIGRLTSVTDQSGSTSYFYNGFGQVTKETRVINGKTYITEYHFDTNGQLTGITYPSGRRIDYTFDTLNRISGITTNQNNTTETLASNIEYLPFGPMKSVDYGNGKSLTQTFDLDYRLTDKTTLGIHQMSYGYDVTDNITSITDSIDATKSQAFTYDKLSRLLSADGGYGNLGFTYDKIGNRLSKTDNSNVDTYAYASDTHRLLNITGANPNAFTHDAIGNTLTKGDLTFTYNKQGRLKSASKTGMNAEYVYNFQGQRVSKQVDGITTHFIYDLNGQLIAEADSNGTIIKEYAYINGQRLSVFENGATYFVHTDHLGTPIALSDSTGTVQWKAHYTPFGKAIVEVNNLTQNIRFPGQYFDAESGLHYNYFRDYDPEIGRYIQSDPIGLNGGINTYGYVGGNPVNWVDPLGLYSTIQMCTHAKNWEQCSAAGGNHAATAQAARAAARAASGNGDDPECEDDECEKLNKEMKEVAQKVRGRAEDLLVDKCNQYDFAYITPNPSANCGGSTTYTGHQRAMQDTQNRLNKLIKKANKNGCNIPAGVWKAATRGIPLRPRGL